MSKLKPNQKRCLAIYPISRGFGFVVLEGPRRLIDWGVVHVRRQKHPQCLARIVELVNRYEPDAVVSEDARTNSRRSGRVRKLLSAVRSQMIQERTPYKKVTNAQVRKRFSMSDRSTKYAIAQAVVEQFPELALRLPPRRKPWTSEDPRMAIFDAAALALTYL